MEDNVVLEYMSHIQLGDFIQWILGIGALIAVIIMCCVKIYGYFEKFKAYKDAQKNTEKTSKQNMDSIEGMKGDVTCLKVALVELLKSKINEKYKYYISMGGIPEDELDEFICLHDAYNGLGGNHTGDEKFNRAMKLPIIKEEKL